MMNTIVGSMKTDSVGIARIEQVGASKVTHVGSSFATQVGKAWSLSVGETAKTEIGKTAQLIVGEASETQVGKTKTIDVGQVFEITAGERFVITVGACRFQMDKSGTVTITAPTTTIVKGGGAQFTIGPGPILYIPELVKGGGGSPPGTCLRRMAQAGVPFVAQKGDWDGHVKAFNQLKSPLRKAINRAKRNGCSVPDGAEDWLDQEAPSQGKDAVS